MEPALSGWIETAGAARTVVRGSCFIGRSSSCGLVVADPKASRQHALIHAQEQGEFWLIDLGSINGTYINGRRVSQPCCLSDGDQITVAGATFTFHSARKATTTTRLADGESAATLEDIRPLTCWLLVADIQGSTELLRRLPEQEAPRVTGLWLSNCRKLLEEQRGTINKFLGDGFFAYWLSEPDSPRRVVASLLGLKEMQKFEAPGFRIVIHHGTVLAGGAASMGEESLSGQEVTFVFRAEKLGAALGTQRLLTEPAQALLKDLIPIEAKGRHPLSGFPGDFAFYSF